MPTNFSPKISVVIPAYNTAKYICMAVDSALAQTYPDFEIIVIDDGSNDDTKGVLSHYGDKIKYIYQDNSGVSAARNRGILEARGEYVAFLDADDSWFPDKLLHQVSVAQHNPQINFFFTDAEIFNDKGIVKPLPLNIKDHEIDSFRHKKGRANSNDGSILKGDFYKDLLIGNFIFMSTVFIRKEHLNKIGCFDENLTIGEDYDFFMRNACNQTILYLNTATARYRLRDDSSSGKVGIRNFLFKSHDAEVLKKQLRDSPKPYKDLINKRIINSYKTAIWGYYNLEDFNKVRTLCLRSLNYDKSQIKLYLYLLATFFPAGLIKSRTRLGS